MLSGDEILTDKIQKIPTAIFLIIPDEKTSYHKLVSLFIKQSYETLIYNAQNINGSKIRVNYILDEFSSLPTIHDFPAMITAARSRNIRFNLFVQSKHQLDLKYGEESNTIRANCSNWIFLVSRELGLLKEISELCGEKRIDGFSRPVVTITDLQRMDKDLGEALILNGRKKPFVTTLADINLYDNNLYSTPKFELNNYQLEYIDFKSEIKYPVVESADNDENKDYASREFELPIHKMPDTNVGNKNIYERESDLQQFEQSENKFMEEIMFLVNQEFSEDKIDKIILLIEKNEDISAEALDPLFDGLSDNECKCIFDKIEKDVRDRVISKLSDDQLNNLIERLKRINN